MTTKSRVSTFPRNRVDEVSYVIVKNSPATNLLTKTRIGKDDIDPVTGDAVIKNKGLTLRIIDFASFSITKVRSSTYRLFDVLLLQFTKDGAKSPIIKLLLADYMQLCGLKDKKEAYKQLKKDLALLIKFSLSYQKEGRTKDKGKNILEAWYKDFGAANICSNYYVENGVIYFELTRFFYEHFCSCPVMPIPKWLFMLKINHNPHAYYLARKLCEHHNMNYHKPNTNIISVKTLLEACPDLPTKKNAGKRFSQLIKIPFERDMEALELYVQWEYCNSNGTPLTETQLGNFTYDVFITLCIKFQINEYPTRLALPKRTKRKQRKKK